MYAIKPTPSGDSASTRGCSKSMPSTIIGVHPITSCHATAANGGSAMGLSRIVPSAKSSAAANAKDTPGRFSMPIAPPLPKSAAMPATHSVSPARSRPRGLRPIRGHAKSIATPASCRRAAPLGRRSASAATAS